MKQIDSFDICYLLSIRHLVERSIDIFIVVSVIYFDALSAMMMMNIKREQYQTMRQRHKWLSQEKEN